MAMMRARQVRRPCRVHGSWCEVSQERLVRERTYEKREWAQEVTDALIDRAAAPVRFRAA